MIRRLILLEKSSDNYYYERPVQFAQRILVDGQMMFSTVRSFIFQCVYLKH